MGYDATQFIGEVDMEFYCAICKMVLERPLETPCEHAFCDVCIKRWLFKNAICPVDRLLMTKHQLKPLSRIPLNLLNKLEIKCDFEQKGCPAINRLDNLKNHLSCCEYNPYASVICDKGCSIEMPRHEYQDYDCKRHLAVQVDRQKVERNCIAFTEALADMELELDILGIRSENQLFEQAEFEL